MQFPGRGAVARLSVCLICFCFLVIGALGCGRFRSRPTRPVTAEPVSGAEKPAEELKTRVADVTVRGSSFEARDPEGRLVLSLQVASTQTALSAARGVEGAVTLERIDGILYREGEPSLWVKAPEAVWENGVLRAVKGVRSGSADGRLACEGARAEWTASTDLLRVQRARCDARDQRVEMGSKPARPSTTLRAEGPLALWHEGRLTMPEGFKARTTDGATLEARQLVWRPEVARVLATGDVTATRHGARIWGERLVADTQLRRIQVTGRRPTMAQAPARPAPTPPKRLQRSFTTFGDWRLEYDEMTTDFGAQPVRFEASGNVVVKGPDATITAPHVTGQLTGAQILMVRASGGVVARGVEEGGRWVEVRGREALYEPEKDQVRLTGDAQATFRSPLLAEPARLKGEQVVAQLKAQTATVTAAPGARVQLTLQPKEQPEPAELTAARIRFDGAADRMTAEGRPTICTSQGRLTADRIEVDVTEDANNIMVARATGDVMVDVKWAQPRPQAFEARAREATYVRARQQVTLRGDVRGSMTSPEVEKPATFAGEVMTFDLNTRRLTMTGDPARAQVVPPKKRGSRG